MTKKTTKANKAKDRFGNSGKKEMDHTYPKSKGGSNTKQNKQSLTKKSNLKKSDKLKGTINGKKFKVTKIRTDAKGKKVGKMQITKSNKKSNK